MNEPDKDDILALRVENDKPIQVEVKQVVPMMTKEQAVEVAARLQQAAAQRAMTPAEQFVYGGLSGGGLATEYRRQQAASPFGRTIFGGIG